MYLDDNGTGRVVVDAADLPQRQAGDAIAGNTLAFGAVNDYQDYPGFIRGIARGNYNENNLNGFVVEICRKINLQRLSEYRFADNLIDQN